ncbi:MAG: hypothetical protein R2794_08115 [Chitinophagales bacterium]
MPAKYRLPPFSRFAACPSDALYMQRCLELASLAGGRVLSNPLVGAVIVHEGRIIGEDITPHSGKRRSGGRNICCRYILAAGINHVCQSGTM